MPSTKARSKPVVQADTAKRKNQSVQSAEPAQAAQRESAEAKIADYISKTVAAAPPLDDEQRARLTTLLRATVTR